MRALALFIALLGGVLAQDPPATEASEHWPPGHVIDQAAARTALDAMRATWSDAATWTARRKRIRTHVLKTFLLDPPPARTPLEMVVHSTVEHRVDEKGGYRRSNVFFESFPGLFVAGNLYEPLGREGPLPVVACPHGHMGRSEGDAEGRMHSSYQTLCATLARMGAIVITWDMVGWAESSQMQHGVPMSGAIQTWNTMRAIDAALTRPGADPSRIGCTGSSGGGTQTFLGALADDRIVACAPVVMVSAHWFGGCGCESGLPIHAGPGFVTNNVEFAACAAPRPQLLVSVGGDWTCNTATVEQPYLADVYEALGAADDVHNVHLESEQHDYGPSKRAPVVRFLARELGLDLACVTRPDGSIDESFVRIAERPALLAFTDEHPMPERALQGTDAVVARWVSLEREP
ncbi:MAG: acetylxylan esterase [Planctomycetota bacterium]